MRRLLILAKSNWIELIVMMKICLTGELSRLCLKVGVLNKIARYHVSGLEVVAAASFGAKALTDLAFCHCDTIRI